MKHTFSFGLCPGHFAARGGAELLPFAAADRKNALSLQLFGAAEELEAGVMAAAAVPQGASGPREDRVAAFEALIRGEYKDLFGRKVQEILRRRLKNDQTQREELGALFAMMAQRYGLEADEQGTYDLGRLTAAYAADNESNDRAKAHFEQDLHALQSRCDELEELLEQEQLGRKADRLYGRWSSEAEKLKTCYPGFCLQKELANPRFTELLRSDVDLRTAYEVCHRDELLGALHSQLVTAGRPRENGMGDQGAASVQTDISKLSKAQRRDIIRRVQKGETIRF